MIWMCLLWMVACAQPRYQASEPQQSFYKSMSGLCGKSFSGTVIYPADGQDPFAGAPLVMYVQACSDSTLRVPFTVGEDKSRTWVISKTAEGLQLKHDHRHEDGTPDEITLYGGTASTAPTALEQRFPADTYTAELLPAAATNEWTLVFSPDGRTFSYILKRDNQLRFQADFDLTRPLEK
ncbi:hypothetical protein [Pontibacter litorisediminis]|uniref:hypothetical protein n=1 Tax=Pontibacter litorisediminis TaxID=1846260 RepID=UPI0023EC15DB|nr:hypothetical protein [Pontibacter litorisediminis]